MKYSICSVDFNSSSVAPLVGAWIEIHGPWRKDMVNKVAPLVGAWIEIVVINIRIHCYIVAPLVGAWIEIVMRKCSAPC